MYTNPRRAFTSSPKDKRHAQAPENAAGPPANPAPDPATASPDTLRSRTTTAARISHMITEAQTAAARARRARQQQLLDAGRAIGAQLTVVQERLLSGEPLDLDVAVAFAAAGRLQLDAIVAQLDRIDLGIDRIAAERTDAADVIAWLEWNAIHLYPYQRRQIERLLAA